MNKLAPNGEADTSGTTAEDRAALVDVVHRLLSRRSDEMAVRRTMVTDSGYDQALWKELADLGIAGIIIDAESGGTGMACRDLEAVAEEVGGALLCSPFLASSVFGASLLQALDRRERLAAIADGSQIVTVAVAGRKGTWSRDDIEVSAEDGRLTGRASYVLDGQNADILLVVARAGDDIEIHEVLAGSAGVTIEPLHTFDRTRRLAHIQFDGVEGHLIGKGWAPVERALDVARIALAGEQAGGGREILDRTVGYIKERFQFGRAVGSFQALKHMAADLLVESESAISAARDAAGQFDDGSPGADTAIALASFACADAFVRISADAIQMHGGIGFTWEHPAHLFLRRAHANACLLGSPAFYRERFLQSIGQPGVGLDEVGK